MLWRVSLSKLIYHYSDANALKSIIENKEIWLTGHSFLNDEMEFHEGFDLLNKNIGKVVEQNNFTERSKQILSEITDHFSSSLVFSCSFSSEPDLLSQWRSYCPQDGGFSIGFDKELLQKSICGHNPTGNIRRFDDCIYDESEKLRQAEVIADGCCKGIDLHFEKMGRDVFYNTFLEFLFYSFRCKNSHFIEEKEVRVFTYAHNKFERISINDGSGFPAIEFFSKENVQFRTNKNIFIPYLKQSFPIEAIKEIYVGPCKNRDVVVQGLQLFLQNLGLINQVNIILSNIPYRRF